MVDFIVIIIKVILGCGLITLWFELFNAVSFNLIDKWYYDFIRFVFVWYLPISFIFFFIIVVL